MALEVQVSNLNCRQQKTRHSELLVACLSHAHKLSSVSESHWTQWIWKTEASTYIVLRGATANMFVPFAFVGNRGFPLRYSTAWHVVMALEIKQVRETLPPR
jgi:hypothetical protein